MRDSLNFTVIKCCFLFLYGKEKAEGEKKKNKSIIWSHLSIKMCQQSTGKICIEVLWCLLLSCVSSPSLWPKMLRISSKNCFLVRERQGPSRFLLWRGFRHQEKKQSPCRFEMKINASTIVIALNWDVPSKRTGYDLERGAKILTFSVLNSMSLIPGDGRKEKRRQEKKERGLDWCFEGWSCSFFVAVVSCCRSFLMTQIICQIEEGKLTTFHLRLETKALAL